MTSAFGTGADWENEFWGEMDLARKIQTVLLPGETVVRYHNGDENQAAAVIAWR